MSAVAYTSKRLSHPRMACRLISSNSECASGEMIVVWPMLVEMVSSVSDTCVLTMDGQGKRWYATWLVLDFSDDGSMRMMPSWFTMATTRCCCRSFTTLTLKRRPSTLPTFFLLPTSGAAVDAAAASPTASKSGKEIAVGGAAPALAPCRAS